MTRRTLLLDSCSYLTARNPGRMNANAASRRLCLSIVTGHVAIPGKGTANMSREPSQAGSIPPDRSGDWGPTIMMLPKSQGFARVIGAFWVALDQF